MFLSLDLKSESELEVDCTEDSKREALQIVELVTGKVLLSISLLVFGTSRNTLLWTHNEEIGCE